MVFAGLVMEGGVCCIESNDDWWWVSDWQSPMCSFSTLLLDPMSKGPWEGERIYVGKHYPLKTLIIEKEEAPIGDFLQFKRPDAPFNLIGRIISPRQAQQSLINFIPNYPHLPASMMAKVGVARRYPEILPGLERYGDIGRDGVKDYRNITELLQLADQGLLTRGATPVGERWCYRVVWQSSSTRFFLPDPCGWHPLLKAAADHYEQFRPTIRNPYGQLRQ